MELTTAAYQGSDDQSMQNELEQAAKQLILRIEEKLLLLRITTFQLLKASEVVLCASWRPRRSIWITAAKSVVSSMSA